MKNYLTATTQQVTKTAHRTKVAYQRTTLSREGFRAAVAQAVETTKDNAHLMKEAYQRTTLSREGFRAAVAQAVETTKDNAHLMKEAYQRTTLSREGFRAAFSLAARTTAAKTRSAKNVWKTGFSREGARIAFNGAVRNMTNRRHLLGCGIVEGSYLAGYVASGLMRGKLSGGAVLATAAILTTSYLASAGLRGAYRALKAEQDQQKMISTRHAPPRRLQPPRTARI